MLFGYQVSHADTTAGEMSHVYMEGSSEAGVDIGRMPVHRDEAKAESRQAWRMNDNKTLPGGDALRGHTRSHPEHDG